MTDAVHSNLELQFRVVGTPLKFMYGIEFIDQDGFRRTWSGDAKVFPETTATIPQAKSITHIVVLPPSESLLRSFTHSDGGTSITDRIVYNEHSEPTLRMTRDDDPKTHCDVPVLYLDLYSPKVKTEKVNAMSYFLDLPCKQTMGQCVTCPSGPVDGIQLTCSSVSTCEGFLATLRVEQGKAHRF